MRLFLAINFPEEIKTTIAKVRDKVKEAAVRGNFSSDENLHLTLVFLGECDERQAHVIKAVMDETRFPPLKLTLEKAGFFVRDSGKLWWIKVKESLKLVNLQMDLCVRLSHQGFLLDNRKYAPHITIGREVRTRPEFVPPDFAPVSFETASFELMQSEQINGKLVYTPIYSKRLNLIM